MLGLGFRVYVHASDSTVYRDGALQCQSLGVEIEECSM